MGVEVVGSEMAQVAVDKVAEVDRHEKENGKLDKQSENDSVQREDGVSNSQFPKDAVDEWPTESRIHTFYFVRIRPYDDPKIKAKADLADREIQRCNQARSKITEELKTKKLERREIIEQLKTLRSENNQYRSIFDEKKKEMEPLQQALGKLRTNNTARGGLCSSEEELNELIYSLQYHIQHESISLQEEKQILREIKQLEATREKVIANSAARTKIQDSLGQKEAIQDQVKLMGADLDGVRKEQQSVWAKISQLQDKLKILEAEIESFQGELDALAEKRNKAYDNLHSHRKQRDEGNVHFTDSRKVLTAARGLAANKDIKALEQLSHDEVEKFMSLWSNKKFRDDYEKRLLPSLDSRQLSRDGRMRNPDEKPLLAVEISAPTSEPEPVAKGNVRRAKEEMKEAPQKESLPTEKAQKESAKKDLKASAEHNDEAEEVYGLEKKAPVKEIDEAKLKELKRVEELEKAKQAMERKKKLAEKKANKAAIRAKKEEENKLKKEEKKLKKKSAGSAPLAEPEESDEPDAEAEATEKSEVQDEPSAPVKEKSRKDNPVRHRIRARGGDALPKAILRKKKANNYWMWAGAGGAALLVIVLLALMYYTSSKN